MMSLQRRGPEGGATSRHWTSSCHRCQACSLGGISGAGREVWRGSPNLDPHHGAHARARVCTHARILRSCQNLSWSLPFPGSSHHPPHPDSTSLPLPHSSPTYILTMYSGSQCLGIKIQFLATVCQALETRLCPPPSLPSHTSQALLHPPSRTSQVQCPQLEGSFLPVSPLPQLRHSQPSAQLPHP